MIDTGKAYDTPEARRIALPIDKAAVAMALFGIAVSLSGEWIPLNEMTAEQYKFLQQEQERLLAVQRRLDAIK